MYSYDSASYSRVLLDPGTPTIASYYMRIIEK